MSDQLLPEERRTVEAAAAGVEQVLAGDVADAYADRSGELRSVQRRVPIPCSVTWSGSTARTVARETASPVWGRSSLSTECSSWLAFSPGWCRPGLPHGRPGIRVAHGTRDEVLPVESAGRAVAADLGARGYDVADVEFAGGHVVTPELVADALPCWLG